MKLTACCFCIKASPGPNCRHVHNEADCGGLWGVNHIPVSEKFYRFLDDKCCPNEFISYQIVLKDK